MAQRILVTGPGLIGRHLIIRMLELGHEVLSLSRGLSPIPQQKRYHHMQGCIADPAVVRLAVSGVDGIVHLSARSRAGACNDDPLECLRINTLGTMNVLEAACVQPAKPWVIIMSSAAVRDAEDFAGDVSLRATNDVYGTSKILTELITQRYADEYSLRAVCLRPETVYGSPADGSERLLNVFCRNALLGEPLLVNDNELKMGFVYYMDVVRSIERSMAGLSVAEGGYMGAVYLGTGQYIGLLELAEKVKRFSQSRSEIVLEEDGLGVPFDYSRTRDEIERSKEFLRNPEWTGLDEGISELLALTLKTIAA